MKGPPHQRLLRLFLPSALHLPFLGLATATWLLLGSLQRFVRNPDAFKLDEDGYCLRKKAINLNMLHKVIGEVDTSAMDDWGPISQNSAGVH